MTGFACKPVQDWGGRSALIDDFQHKVGATCAMDGAERRPLGRNLQHLLEDADLPFEIASFLVQPDLTDEHEVLCNRPEPLLAESVP